MFKLKKQGEMDVESKDGLPQKTYGFKQGFSDVQVGLCPLVLIGNRCWFTKKTREGEVSWWKQRYELGCLSESDEQETMKTKQEELMEICTGGRDGAAAVSNKDVNAKAFRKHRKVKEWPGTIETQEEGKGLQHLTSLQELEIRGCDRLEFLPKEGLPASLSFLSIEKCTSLEKRCQKKTGQEWSKIAHIPFIKIDDQFII